MRYLSADVVRETGLLQEINRMFLHPLGFSLELSADLVGSLLEQEQVSRLKIQDHRDDPEGVVYEESEMDGGLYERFQDFRTERHVLRLKTVGFVEQPPPRPCFARAYQALAPGLVCRTPPLCKARVRPGQLWLCTKPRGHDGECISDSLVPGYREDPGEPDVRL